jgi:phosphohistidine phosphatase SixA
MSENDPQRPIALSGFFDIDASNNWIATHGFTTTVLVSSRKPCHRDGPRLVRCMTDENTQISFIEKSLVPADHWPLPQDEDF